MRAARYITGWAQARVSGAQPERILTALAERGIDFWDAAPPRDYTLRFRIPAGAAKLLPRLAETMGCEGVIESVHGIPALWHSARKRRTLLLLLLAAVFALGASLSHIWFIDITGNVTVPDGVIRQALAECGVDIGTNWLAFSQDAVRNGVLLRVPELRWMTVSMQGSRAHVIVREKRTYIEPVPEKEYADIVAAKAGLVTQVQAKRGTAVTEPNKTVLPGEILIGGYRTGRFGVQGPTRAIGTVTARTWYEITAEAPLAAAEKTYTGEKMLRFALILGKLRINFYKGSSICPAECDKIIKRHDAAADGVFTLPLALETVTLRPYETRDVSELELREELSAMLEEELSRRIGEEGEAVEVKYTASEANGVLYVTLRAECLEPIGVPSPIEANEIP